MMILKEGSKSSLLYFAFISIIYSMFMATTWYSAWKKTSQYSMANWTKNYFNLLECFKHIALLKILQLCAILSESQLRTHAHTHTHTHIYIYIYMYIYIYIMSRCQHRSPWTLSPPISIIHCSWEVFKATSYIGTELLFFLTSPAVFHMSGSSNLDSFHDGW